MPSVRSIRRSIPFDPQLVARHPLFWPLARAAQPFAAAHDWPPVATWHAAFVGTPPITFAAAAPRPRGGRRRQAGASGPRYDASIVERGVVPSREGHWHDYLNALVWATFPRAKAALHRRQGALIAAGLHDNGGGQRVAPHRTRAQDGLAMIDEGGVLALVSPTAEVRLVFGHALYEGFVLGVPSMTARMVPLPVPALAPDVLAQADAALAATLADARFSTLPDDLPRVFVPDAPAAPWMPPKIAPL